MGLNKELQLMIAYKLFRKRKDGSYGPLFINRKQRLHVGILYNAQDHPTKGYAHRPGWHCCKEPIAPHLSEKNRVWCEIAIGGKITEHIRPSSQGGIWYTAEIMVIQNEVSK
jgi:hypothetical protein